MAVMTQICSEFLNNRTAPFVDIPVSFMFICYRMRKGLYHWIQTIHHEHNHKGYSIYQAYLHFLVILAKITPYVPTPCGLTWKRQADHCQEWVGKLTIWWFRELHWWQSRFWSVIVLTGPPYYRKWMCEMCGEVSENDCMNVLEIDSLIAEQKL